MTERVNICCGHATCQRLIQERVDAVTESRDQWREAYQMETDWRTDYAEVIANVRALADSFAAAGGASNVQIARRIRALLPEDKS